LFQLDLFESNDSLNSVDIGLATGLGVGVKTDDVGVVLPTNLLSFEGNGTSEGLGVKVKSACTGVNCMLLIGLGVNDCVDEAGELTGLDDLWSKLNALSNLLSKSNAFANSGVIPSLFLLLSVKLISGDEEDVDGLSLGKRSEVSAESVDGQK